jgi:hypothetical protein
MKAERSEQTTETDADGRSRFAAGINLHLSKIPIRIDFYWCCRQPKWPVLGVWMSIPKTNYEDWGKAGKCSQ